MDTLTTIAHIHTDFIEKFGIPRQSGLVEELTGVIVFEPEFRDSSSLEGIEEYRYLWLLWKFEDVSRENWLRKVRPPRLGGNETRGVFATRSPFRPNPIGLSSVKLLGVDYDAENGPVLLVSGIDLRDNTPIYDIKPYLEYVDSHPGAGSGFADRVKDDNLSVVFPPELLSIIPEAKQKAIMSVLSEDPRPHYHNDPSRSYGVSFAGYNIKFKIADGVLTVYEVTTLD